MPQVNMQPFDGPTRANWIRLRTMIFLRWIAIVGQLTAITVAQHVYGMQLEVGLCYFAVGASITGNLVATLVFPKNKRLSEGQNLAMVLFDLSQLAFLLFLTGGLNNPFVVLLLGPVTISAAALGLRSTIVLVVSTVILVTILAIYHLPLTNKDGHILRIPGLFLFGEWTAVIIAIIFTSAYSRRVTSEINSMGDALSATQMALAREQKLTDLGGVVAAAAHELGTPLATIKLASSEMLNELSKNPDFEDLAEDAALIRDQSDRCRDILHDMGRAGKDDLHMRQAPLEAVIAEAAEPHLERGKEVLLSTAKESGNPQSQPNILRKPEVIHGLRNLVQNAVDFADSTVWVEGKWTDEEISVRIVDNGPGFPQHLFGRIGDPFVRRRPSGRTDGARLAYEGMGLGLFIAKTLLERSGATLQFVNGPAGSAQSGAVVEVIWPSEALEVANLDGRGILSQNQQIVG